MKLTNTIRRYYAPLNVAVYVENVNPNVPLTQTYDEGTYIPDRENGSAYSVLRPVVSASADDGTWSSDNCNAQLGDYDWYTMYHGEWTSLSKAPGWTGKYEIVSTSDSERGTLVIKKNLDAGESCTLLFQGKLLDQRNGTAIDIKTDPVPMICVDKGGDSYGLTLDFPENIVYNPNLDKLAEYEYAVARGLTEPSADKESQARDGNEYCRELGISVHKGASVITEGYTLKVYKVVNKVENELTEGESELAEMGDNYFTFDLRLIESGSYVVKAFLDGATTAVASHAFSVRRHHGTVDVTLVNKAMMSFTDVRRWQKALLSVDNARMQYPAVTYLMQWTTTATNGTAVTECTWNLGEYLEYAISDTGIGKSEDDYVSDNLEITPKDAHEVMANESGALLTDENGEILICN